MKFEVGQEVWIIEKSFTKVSSKCDCCDGTGKLLARSHKDIDYTVECVCPNCKGVKAFKTKSKFSQRKTNIYSRFEFQHPLKFTVHEGYVTYENDYVFTDDISECENYLSTLGFMFDAGYNNIDVKKQYIHTINELFATKEDAIEACKKLKK